MKPLLIAALALLPLNSSAETTQPLDFQEVYRVIQTNLVDLSASDLNNSAALGLIKELGTKVRLGESVAAPEEVPDVITRRTVYQTNFGFIRIRAVDERLPSTFRPALQEMIKSNKLEGMVLDLRFANGTNFEAAAQVADAFVKGGQTLLDLGGRKFVSTDEPPSVAFPVVMLVNSETRGAAEALAAILRETASGLIIGTRTAGEARLFETFTLSTGHKLRVGKIPVAAGEGKVIPAQGIVPDIEVTVAPEEEKLFYQDPYRERQPFADLGRTNEVAAASTRPRRMNEAELVRRHREGLAEPVEETVIFEAAPVITDPVLARGLDFLKGISVLSQQRRF